MINNLNLRQESDLPWKYILNLYFRQFMEYCWPDRAKEINWDQQPKFLDKELIKITRDSHVGNKILDKLIEVELINSSRCCILLHIEVQSTKQAEFNKRMFVYRYRLRDLYEQPIASLAILIDNNFNWRPTSYTESLWGSEINMRFPIIKLLDYQNKIEMLEQSTNPFAIVILAQLAALKKEAVEVKLANKFQIVRKLYVSGFKSEQIDSLFKFIDWIIKLPEDQEKLFVSKIKKFKEEEFDLQTFLNTPWSPAEKIWHKEAVEKGLNEGRQQGIQEGIQEGMQQGMQLLAKNKRQIIINMLKQKLPIKLILEITELSIEELEKLVPEHNFIY